MAHIWTSLMLFIEMLQRAITDLFCFGAKSRSVCLFVLRPVRKLILTFNESVNLQNLVFKCISLRK